MKWRLAQAGDLRVLAEMNLQLIADEGHRNPMTVELLEERMRHWLAGEYRAALFVSGTSIDAYALFREDESGRIHLRQFFVMRSVRRRGLGREAFRLFRTEIAPRDKRIVLEVLTANAPARSFWASLGFQDYAITLELSASEPTSSA